MAPVSPSRITSYRYLVHTSYKTLMQLHCGSRDRKNHPIVCLTYVLADSGRILISCSSHIIHQLLEEQGTTKSHTIYFFCDFRDVSAVTPRDIYGSLVAQLIKSNWEGELPVNFQHYFENHNKKPPLVEALKEQLKKLLEQAGSTRIIIDALDECDGSVRMELLGTLLDLKRSRNVNLLVTSREEADIKFLVGDETAVCIRPESNSKDIALFVREETERNRKLSGLKKSTKAEIFSEISTQASGMYVSTSFSDMQLWCSDSYCRFRWAKCSLDQICRLRNDKAIKAALKSLPPGLNETYERILDTIPEEDQELALRIFQWLVSALRPMRIREIIEAVAVELGSVHLDPDALLNDPEDLLDVCRCLVTIDREHGTIGLAHLSVKEFFISSARQNGRHPKFFIKLDQATIEVAKVCLTYLCFEDFSAGPCQTREDFKARLGNYALYGHASTNWYEYAQNHRDLEDEPYLAMIELLFLDQKKAGNFDSWLQAYEALKSGTRYGIFHDNYLERDIQGDNRLVYACRLGLHSAAQFLLGKGIDPNGISTSRKKDGGFPYSPFFGPCGNALNAACEARNLELVKLVQAAGADVNCLAGRNGTALIAAISDNYITLSGAETSKIIEHLVEQGADINRRNAQGVFPLKSAVLNNCRPDIVSLLLELGADLGMRDLYGYTVTESAGVAGLGEIFLLLLDAGGLNYLPDEKDWRFSSPPDADAHAIHCAVGPNLFEVAKRVLEKASKKLFEEYKDLMYNTFRHCAKFGYYMFLQTLLVYSGAPFPGYEDCLREACVRGYKETVKVMIDALPPSTKATDIPGSPLIYAAAKGHEQVVKLLLEAGTDANAADEHGWSAILTAAQYKHHNILEMFNPPVEQLLDLRMRPLGPSSLHPFVYGYIGKIAPVGLIVEGTSAHLSPGTPHPPRPPTPLTKTSQNRSTTTQSISTILSLHILISTTLKSLFWNSATSLSTYFYSSFPSHATYILTYSFPT
jgi:ankyrin repeat protein